jgi:hypothetical protein
MLCAGYFVNEDDLADWFFLKYFSPHRYTFEALIRNEYDDLPDLNSDNEDNYIDEYNFTESYSEAMWILFGIAVGLRVLDFFLLKLVCRRV